MATIYDKKESTQKYIEMYGAMSEEFAQKWERIWQYGAWYTREFSLEDFVSYLHENIDQEMVRHIGKIESYPESTLPRTESYRVCEDEYQDDDATWYCVQNKTGYLIKNEKGIERFNLEDAKSLMSKAEQGLISVPTIDEDDEI